MSATPLIILALHCGSFQKLLLVGGKLLGPFESLGSNVFVIVAIIDHHMISIFVMHTKGAVGLRVEDTQVDRYHLLQVAVGVGANNHNCCSVDAGKWQAPSANLNQSMDEVCHAARGAHWDFSPPAR